MDSRPALKMADRPSLPAESCLTAAEDRQSLAKHLQCYICTNTLLIMLWTQRNVVLAPRAINHAIRYMMAKEAKCAISMSNEMHTRQIRDLQPLSCLIQEARDACMQARLMQHDHVKARSVPNAMPPRQACDNMWQHMKHMTRCKLISMQNAT